MQEKQNTLKECKVSTTSSHNEISTSSPNSNSYEQCSEPSLIDIKIDQVYVKGKKRRKTECENSLIVPE